MLWSFFAVRLLAGPVIAAGSTGSVPATADLLVTIAHLPRGAVILPGLDHRLDGESWAGIETSPQHPQYGMKELLEKIGVECADVPDLPGVQVRTTIWQDSPAWASMAPMDLRRRGSV